MKPVCFLCQEYETDVGHQTILCPKLICKKCHQRGHFAMDCETFCDKSFLQVHEVKEDITEVEDLRNQLKSVKTQVEELELELKISQGKLAFHTGQKNELKNKVPANWRDLKSQKNKQFVQKSCYDQTNEPASIKQELQFVKVANQDLFQKIQEFEIKKQTFANNDSLDRNLEIKVEDETTLEIQENEKSTKRKMNQESFKTLSNTKKKLEAHVLRHGPKIFKCHYYFLCKKKFSLKSDQKLHEKEHTEKFCYQRRMKDQAQSFQGKFTTWAFKAGKLSGGVPVGAPMGISIPPPMNTPPPSLPGIMRPPPGIPPFGAPGVTLGTGPPQGLPPNMMGQLRPGMGLPIGHPQMMGPLRPGMGPPMGPRMGGMPLGPRPRLMPSNMMFRLQR